MARVLIAALVFSLVPQPCAEASIQVPASPSVLVSRAFPDLAASAAVSAEDVLVCVVVVIADPSGLTKSAFGELLSHTGTDPQPYAFTGEPLDPNSGWLYHRARWMDPTTGRFTGMDLFGGRPEDPGSAHRYRYAAANPVDKVDPTGLFESLATLSIGFSMMNTINAISLPSLGSVLNSVRPQMDYKMDFNGRHLRVLKKAGGEVLEAYEALTGDPYYGWSEPEVGPTPPAKYRVNKSDIQVLNGTMGAAWGVGRVQLQPDDSPSKFFGRTGFYLHGGELTQDGRPWFTHGCIKVTDANWRQIIDKYVRGNLSSYVPLTIDYAMDPYLHQ